MALYENGAFVYTPAAGFFGVDRFTYHVTDQREVIGLDPDDDPIYALSDPVTVIITVTNK